MSRNPFPGLARLVLILAIGWLIAPPLYGQTFTLVTDGEIATDTDNAWGAAWVDIDNDGDLDLYVVNASFSGSNTLYRNDGDGTFTKITGSPILDDTQAAIGTCWADYDNDGDLDVANAGGPNSFLYQNDGSGVFTKITEGDIGGATVNRGWSCAWGDYNNDGHVDLFISHPAGFVGAPVPNSLFQNNGDGTFTRITDSPIVMGLAPYTVGNWIDFDDDGDLDLFIGSGPANGTQDADFLYRNELSETGTATFTRITDLPLNEIRDGQTWNFIDFDNDGDRDAYVTNYWGGLANGLNNDFYLNISDDDGDDDDDGFAAKAADDDGDDDDDDGDDDDEEPTFVKVTSGPLVTDEGFSLANVWGDFDNDGDLDVVVTNDFGQDNVYYRNEGPPTFAFTRTTAFDGTATGNFGATAGDYDLDGDLDLFVPSYFSGQRLFYQTEAPAANHWINLRLVGVASNQSGVGAKVRARATIGGQKTWQRREVSTQNTFNGHNSLNVHFGLGDADVVKKLEITWPSGIVDKVSRVEADVFYAAVEGEGLVPLGAYLVEQLESRVDDLVAAGTLNGGQGNALNATFENATEKIKKGKNNTASNVLGALLNQVDDFVDDGILSEEEGRRLVDPVQTALSLLDGNTALAKAAQDAPALAEDLPTTFSLSQNHPNPFNPATTIAYSVPLDGPVTLKVYDVQGRVVATLVEGFQPAGQHQVRWEAANLASGVYLYRLEAGGVAQARLLHLIK